MKKNFMMMLLGMSASVAFADPIAVCKGLREEFDRNKTSISEFRGIIQAERFRKEEGVQECQNTVNQIKADIEELAANNPPPDFPNKPLIDAKEAALENQIATCSQLADVLEAFRMEMANRLRTFTENAEREMRRVSRDIDTLQCNHPCHDITGYCPVPNRPPHAGNPAPASPFGVLNASCQWQFVPTAGTLPGPFNYCQEHYNANPAQVTTLREQCDSISGTWNERRPCPTHAVAGVCTILPIHPLIVYVHRSFDYLPAVSSPGEMQISCGGSGGVWFPDEGWTSR